MMIEIIILLVYQMKKKNVSFESENINDEVSMLDCSSYNKTSNEILNNLIESNLINDQQNVGENFIKFQFLFNFNFHPDY